MKWAKIFMSIIILAAIILGGIILINTFFPNPWTGGIATFLTITVPTYVMSKFEWVMLSIGGIATAAGAAIKSINKTKDQADAAVTQAKDEAAQAKNFASDQFGEVDKLTKEKEALQTQVNEMQSTRTEAEQLASQQQTEITTLRRELRETKEQLANTPVKIVEYQK